MNDQCDVPEVVQVNNYFQKKSGFWVPPNEAKPERFYS
jgi:hypothetical protein